MGRQDSPLELGRESVLHFPVRLKIVAAPGQLEQLRDAAGTEWFEGIDVAPLELNQALSESMLQDAEILVVHVDLGVPDSMQRIEWVRTRRPDLPLVVALADADIRLVRTLVRQGVADVVTLPLNPDCAQTMQFFPICTLWAICTRLSILVPSPIIVSRMLPRSMLVPAPISTSLRPA